MEVYCDHCATTPLDPRVEDAMRPFQRERFGNPSSAHGRGRRARDAVEQARRTVARAIGAQPEEIVFTSSATEANNLALRGYLAAAGHRPAHLVASCIEHPCVSEVCGQLQRLDSDCSISVVLCPNDGVVRVDDVVNATRSDTALVALMHVNNETGMIQPVAELARALQGRGIPLLCDAVQSFGRVPVSVDELGCDFLTISGHKIYGPQGVGALYLRSGTTIEPVILGGGQERGLRSGTENVAGIVGFARAVELAVREQTGRRSHLEQCEAEFLEALERERIEYSINGASSPRAPGILNLSFAGCPSAAMVAALDEEGIAVSAGSACGTDACGASSVLAAMGLDPHHVGAALRFSFGMGNMLDEVRWAGERVAALVRRRTQWRD